MEVSKIPEMMSDLFRRCKRRPEQFIWDFNLDFERLILRLQEIDCSLPPVVKALLYLHKLRLTEGEQLTLLVSIGNRYKTKLLQHAALLQDRHLRSHAQDDARPRSPILEAEGARWSKPNEQVHVNVQTAADHHTAFVAYQAAKASRWDSFLFSAQWLLDAGLWVPYLTTILTHGHL